MEPDLQKLAATALGGLVLFFPVFNAVGDTALEALYDADHKSKFKDFFKDWGDIPEDEKLRYWDGKTKPPAGQGGDNDDFLDDDSQVRPPGDPGSQDEDGDGVPDAEDPDPKDPNVTQEREFHMESEVLWTFIGEGGQVDLPFVVPDHETDNVFEDLLIEWAYTDFSGNAAFALTADGVEIWSLPGASGQVPLAIQSDDGSNTAPTAGATTFQMDVKYDPLAAPESFTVTVSGSYKVYEDEA